MRPLLGVACFVVMAACVLLTGASGGDKGQRVTVRLLDAATNKATAGLVRILPEKKDQSLELTGLYDRLKGLGKKAPGKGWYVVPAAGGETTLPPGKYRIEALSGLESSLGRQTLTVRLGVPASADIKLAMLFRPEERRLVAGNTHLHLRGMTLPQADEYLRTIPPADRLGVLFLSFLERHKDDRDYISNRYPLGHLKQFDVTGVLISNGEEHRHNFKAYGQGYGHVILLDIQRLVKPVSIGPGIMGAGVDDTPLRPGIDDARRQGGTVIWCHNTYGHEDVLSAITNRLHALNVADGNPNLNYEENYYRYLNCGLRMPISTGTDWFMYDFSRVYARVPGDLTNKSWLQAVKDGRCHVTNGPLLSLTVAGKDSGDVIELDKTQRLTVKASAVGRHDFQHLELLHNGRVIHTTKATAKGGHYVADMTHAVNISEPSWFATRIRTQNRNELGQLLFAHTSPVYIRLAGRDIFNIDAARALLRQMEEGRAAIRAQGIFSGADARRRVLSLYDSGIEELTDRMNKRSKQ